MAEVTVEQYAGILNISTDRLIKQLESAGVAGKKEKDLVSDEEKQTLLTSLRSSHGASAGGKARTSTEGKKLTLKRKTTETLSAGAKPAARAKGVNVEIRKKKTFVKKPATPVAAQEPSADEVEKRKRQESIRAKREEEDRKLTELEKQRKKAHLEKKEQVEREAVEKQKQEEESAKAVEKETKRREIEARQAEDAAKGVSKTAKPANKTEKKANYRKPDKSRGKTFGREELHIRKGAEKRRKNQPIKDDTKKVTLSAGSDHGFTKPTKPVILEVEVPETITVGELAQKMSVKAGDLLKVMMENSIMATINQTIDQDTAYLLVEEMGHTPVAVAAASLEDEVLSTIATEDEEGEPRAPVVTIMGHVDHGKTSLLDYIRQSQVTKGEAGGITQHIGAYKVKTDNGEIAFLDTPGHAAFTAMRARGAKVTDIVIVVVASDDGVMPQTIEAIEHAKAADVPIIIAVNKMDKPEADPDRVKNEMSQHEVVPEDWGGDVAFVPVSAHTGQGVDELLESVLLNAEILELTAATNAKAKGSIVESRIDKGRGPVATIMVQSGTLKQGDILLAGREYGRVRSMVDDQGSAVKSAGPSTPVEILGLSGAPEAGSDAVVVERERQAREIVQERTTKYRDLKLAQQKQASLDRMFSQMEEGDLAEVNILVKSDVHGSAEAIRESLMKLSNEEVKVNVVASGVGGINESDANLALASNAIIMGFNVRADASAKKIISKEGLDLHYFSIIYDLIDQVKNLVLGEMKPEFSEEIIGLAEVRDVFRAPKIGAIAGCMVVDGTVKRNSPIRVLRDNIVIFEGELESLRRFKDDVSEVKSGTECGIGVKSYNDVQPGDQIEVFDRIEIKRTL